MFTLACKDLGTPECGYTAKEDDAEKAVYNMIQHAQRAHSDKLAGLSKKISEKEIFDMMMSKVEETQ